MNLSTLTAFGRGYLECMLWLECSGDSDCPDCGMTDLSDETAKQIVSDCEDFESAHREKWRAAGWPDEQAGHDFFLTRNGHGAGFWDRGREPAGRELSDAAKVYGTFGLYLGDDGKLYHHN